MKIAIIGGTHGNEPCGVEVVRFLERSKPNHCVHDYKTFHGNPEAYRLKKRYVDTDLNRSFGLKGIRKGYEESRVQTLESQIRGQFDLAIDLHTTTTNMGMTLILNNTHLLSRQVVGWVQAAMPEVKIIEEVCLDGESTHLNRLAPAGVTIEVGPVANNVLSAQVIFQIQSIVTEILSCPDFSRVDLSQVEYFKEIKPIPYPKSGKWYVHPDIEGRDFEKLQPGDSLFINAEGEVLCFEGSEAVYPFFINEAAYIEKDMAMIIGSLEKGF